MEKALKNTPYKGGVATFVFTHGPVRLETLPEFMPPPKKSPTSFQLKTNMFALHLMRLWTPKTEETGGSFIPNYQACFVEGTRRIKEIDLPPKVTSFDKASPELFQAYFSSGDARNLGAITFLNLLMSGDFQSQSLGVVERPDTGAHYFTQKLSFFWQDYFNGPTPLRLFSVAPFEHKLKGFSREKTHKAWWDVALGSSGNSFRALFLNEIFETALRIYLTPMQLLNEIGHQVLGQDALRPPFQRYVLEQISFFKKNFRTLFHLEEQMDWIDFLDSHGEDRLTRYTAELLDFHANGNRIIPTTQAGPLQASILISAIQLTTPNLINHFSLDVIHYLSYTNKLVCMTYLVDEAHRDLGAFIGHDAIWDVMDELAKTLNFNIEFNENPIVLLLKSTDYLSLLVLKSTQLEKQHLASFLNSQSAALAVDEPVVTRVHIPIELKAPILRRRPSFFSIETDVSSSITDLRPDHTKKSEG
jgi:hypothetical protein